MKGSGMASDSSCRCLPPEHCEKFRRMGKHSYFHYKIWWDLRFCLSGLKILFVKGGIPTDFRFIKLCWNFNKGDTIQHITCALLLGLGQSQGSSLLRSVSTLHIVYLYCAVCICNSSWRKMPSTLLFVRGKPMYGSWSLASSVYICVCPWVCVCMRAHVCAHVCALYVHVCECMCVHV